MIPLSSPPPSRSSVSWHHAVQGRDGEGALRSDPSLPFISYYLEMAEEILRRAEDQRPYWPPGLQK
ncbi:MAG: hypothetical protein JST92_24695 [Deltaproteobacteria bacterium]|nr:hypothetical protein [Deltaproteobacteria bacterium]